MRAYTSKEELKDEIKKTYTKFIAEFDNIPEEMKDLRAEDVDRTPAENLAYKVGWTTLVLKWEQDERNGLEVKPVRSVQVEPAGGTVSVVHGYLCRSIAP